MKSEEVVPTATSIALQGSRPVPSGCDCTHRRTERAQKDDPDAGVSLRRGDECDAVTRFMSGVQTSTPVSQLLGTCMPRWGSQSGLSLLAGLTTTIGLLNAAKAPSALNAATAFALLATGFLITGVAVGALGWHEWPPAVLEHPGAVAGTWIRGPDVVEHTREVGELELPRAVDRVAAELRDRGRLSAQSEPRVLGLFERFGVFVSRAFGVASLQDVSREHVEAFVRASTVGTGEAPSVATMQLRRSALRLLFRTARELDLLDGDPTVDLVLPSRTNESARPLTDDEVEQCRRVCLHDLASTRLSVAWALGEATARTGEIPHITVDDLDLETARVWIHGSSKTEARWGALTDWGAGQVARHVRGLSPGARQRGAARVRRLWQSRESPIVLVPGDPRDAAARRPDC